MKISNTSEYGPLIEGFFHSEFPGALPGNSPLLVDTLTQILVSTNRYRFGPAPNPESLVAIREVIRSATAGGRPIPLLVPWGSKKPGNDPTSQVDLAEVMALKQLQRLQECVTPHYAPGLDVRLRIEDTSGWYLFEEETKALWASERYVEQLEALLQILDFSWLTPVAERTIMNAMAFNLACDKLVPLFEQAILEGDQYGEFLSETRGRLADEGWQGEINAAQKDFYRSSYRKNFPGISPEHQNRKLARYFANSLVRYRLQGTGAAPKWGGQYLQLNFAPPVPGAPAGLVSKRLYYRTIPANWATTHMPPWRGKGYFLVGNDNAVTPKLTSWHEPRTYLPCVTEFGNASGVTVTITTDLVLEGVA